MQIVVINGVESSNDHSTAIMSWLSGDFSVLLSAIVVLICCAGGRSCAPSNSRVWMALIILVWYWTTSTWAVETKNIVLAFSAGTGDVPLLAFWLTFAPQFASAAIFAGCVFSRLGVNAAKDILTLGRSGGFWLVAGAAFWYGQFFTVQSMIFGAPALTFIVKAAEPLSTALLAGWVLRKAYSLPLFLGLLIACVGIMICVSSAHNSEEHAARFSHEVQWIGLVFAVLANFGFSSRACLAKKAIGQLNIDPCVAFGIMTIVGGLAGMLPLFVWTLTSHIGLAGDHVFCPFFDSRFEVRPWLMMCISYTLYQTCSILILSSVAVESHGLLVAMKHVLVVLLVSLLIHAHLTQGICMGMALTVVGVYVYSKSIQQDAPKEDEDGKDPDLKVAQILGELGETCKAPQTPRALEGFVMVLSLIGALTAPLLSFMQIRNTNVA